MLYTEVGRGGWGVILDANLIRLSPQVTTAPALIDVSLQQTLMEVLGMYRLVEAPDYLVEGKSVTVDLLAGGRYYQVSNRLTIDPFGPRPTLQEERSKTWVDLVIGARARAPLTNRLDARDTTGSSTWKSTGKRSPSPVVPDANQWHSTRTPIAVQTRMTVVGSSSLFTVRPAGTIVLMNTKLPLIVTAVVELATGTALLITPSLTAELMLGAGLGSPASVRVGRVAGTALFSISLSCWLERNRDRSGPRTGLVVGLLAYNVSIPVLLADAAVVENVSGIAFWPGSERPALGTLDLVCRVPPIQRSVRRAAPQVAPDAALSVWGASAKRLSYDDRFARPLVISSPRHPTRCLGHRATSQRLSEN